MSKPIANTKKELKVFLIDIVPPSFPSELIEYRLSELSSLVTTYQGIVVVRKIQKRMTPDYRTYIGSGKLEEIRQEMIMEWANLLVIGNILKPAQVYKISEILRKDNIQVWDRVDLILKIFERHAKSTEARLQIELASIKHMGPRIFGMGMELSRQGGGTGGGKHSRGSGETNTEIMRRHLRDKEIDVRKKLEHYQKTRSLHRTSRSRQGLQTVGIVGYTNAGKSELMHSLTNKDILIENKLFATLGTAVGKMYIAPTDETIYSVGTEILINDTIGFIRDLPPDLIDAFTSTLEDSIFSDLLLHVIDAADEHVDDKMQIVDDILTQIGAKQPKLYVFNKIDLLSASELKALKKKYAHLSPLRISAQKKEWLEELKKAILRTLPRIA